jgi:hypothetical protein
MNEVFFVMMILLGYGLAGVATHFLLSRRCFKLTGNLPNRGVNEFNRMLIRCDVDLFCFSLIWPVLPLVWFWYLSKPFTYYEKLVKMGLEDEEVEEEEEDLSRGAYR